MKLLPEDWLTAATIDPSIHELRPDYRALLVAATGIHREALEDIAQQLVMDANRIASELVSTEPDPDKWPHIGKWREAYRQFGVKPNRVRVSADALTRRAAREGLPRINPIVDAYNALSVIHHTPIGGEDLDLYDGTARLIRAAGDESFHTTANGERVVEYPEPGEPVWTDNTGVTCRYWNWRQTYRTAISDDTSNALFIIDALDSSHPDNALQQVTDVLRVSNAAVAHRRLDASRAG